MASSSRFTPSSSSSPPAASSSTSHILSAPKYLNTPYSQKDQAKALGARWDPAKKKWYVPAGWDPAPFARWFEDERGWKYLKNPTGAPEVDSWAEDWVGGHAEAGELGYCFDWLEHGQCLEPETCRRKHSYPPNWSTTKREALHQMELANEYCEML